MYACSEASVAATQDTGGVQIQWSLLLIGTIWKITLTYIRCTCILLQYAQKDGHPNWSRGIPWYDYWYVGIATAYMNSSLWRRRDRRLSTGGVGTPPDQIVVGKLSELERSNYSGSNSVRTCLDDIKNSQKYEIVREWNVAEINIRRRAIPWSLRTSSNREETLTLLQVYKEIRDAFLFSSLSLPNHHKGSWLVSIISNIARPNYLYTSELVTP